MAALPIEKGRQEYAWVLVLVGGLLDVYGVLRYGAQNGWVLPYPDYIFGTLVLIGGIIEILVAPTLFKKGAKWGLYLVLLGALFALANGIFDMIVISPLVGFLLFLFYGGPAWLALWFTYGKFFPTKPVTAP